MNDFLNGRKLYGDDFTSEQIKNWYEQEKEAYAGLGSKNIDDYRYGYHALNEIHGFKYVKGKAFNNVLGLGAAWGHEFHPIIDRIGSLHILEPSEQMRSEKVGNLKPVYTSPTINGDIKYPDDYFDLVTSFGTLHHIPNVSFVFSELCRVTKPGGYLLLREPVVSMGDWTKPRQGLTANERGIPLLFFRDRIKQHSLKVVNEAMCFTTTAFLQRKLGKLVPQPLHAYKGYILGDKWLSKLLARNLNYHATGMLQRIAPQAVYYVLKKPD